MQAKSFKIFNVSEIEFLQQHFFKRVQSWAQSWAPEVGFSLDVTNADMKSEQLKPILASENIMAFTNGDSYSAAVGWREDFISSFPAAIYSLLSDKVAQKKSPVMTSFAKRAVEELVESICQNEVVAAEGISNVEAQLDDIDKPGIAGIGVIIELASEKVYLLFNTDLAQGILKANGKDKVVDDNVVLAKRSSGLGKEQVNLELGIGEAEIDFASLQALAVGDVITFDRKATEALIVQVKNGERICNGYLGMVEGNTSVQIAGK